MIHRSFPLRVLAISFIVIALPLLIDSFLFFKNAYRDSVADIESGLKEEAQFKAFSLTEIAPVRPVLLREVELLLNLNEEISALPSEKFDEVLKKIVNLAPNIGMYVLDLGDEGKYKILSSSHTELIGRNFKNIAELPQIERDGEGGFWGYFYNPQERRNVPYLYYGRLIRSKETGKPAGILLIVTDMTKPLASLLQKEALNGLEVSFAIVSPQGVVFASSDPSLDGQLFKPLSQYERRALADTEQFGNVTLGEKPLTITNQSKNGHSFDFIYEDRIYGAYRIEVPSLGASLVAFTAKEAVFKESMGHFLLIYLIFALIFIVGAGVTYWLTLWMSRPLNQLSKVMGRVQEGDLAVRFKPEPLGFEINLLGGIFNHTLSSLLETMQHAEDERVRTETYQKELAIGREVQENLLPRKMPPIPGVELAAQYLSAEDVGGDFYDVRQKENHIFLMIADAAGIGISACLYSLGLRSLLRTCVNLYDDVGEILKTSNTLFCVDTGESGAFATVLMGRYDLESKKLSYFSCGHVPGIVRKSDGRLIILEHTGMALGLQESEGYRIDEIQLESGDLLLFYTDGLIEAANEKHQLFSLSRLKSLLQQRRWESAEEIVQGLKKEVEAFRGTTPQEEEISILAMRIL